MKQLLTLKWIDLIAQLLAIVLPLLTTSINNAIPYFLIAEGSVQTLSCIINRIFLKRRYRNVTRIGYELLMLILGLSAAMYWLFQIEFFAAIVAYILLYASGFMALWYLLFTIAELKKIRKLIAGEENTEHLLTKKIAE